MVDPLADPIELVPSRYGEWQEHFDAERERIQKVLDARNLTDEVERIEHVGSTAVPDLAAKDIVDLDVVVADDAVTPVAEAVESDLGGKRHRNSPTWNPIFREHDGQRFNVHVFAVSGEKWRVSVATRDVLRAHEDVREAYEARKRELTEEHDELVPYSQGKTDLVGRLLQRARADEDLAFDFDVPEGP